MAGALTIKNGTKLRLALDAPIGKEPDFNMVCTFARALDESAFLISIPMKDGKAITIDENQKLLIRYGDQGGNAMIVTGYVDDVVREGIRRYFKIRRVSEQRQFFQRTDERLKVAIPIRYRQDTWASNEDGIIEKDEGMSLDISAGGMAAHLNHRFEVGEICQITVPDIGTAKDGRGIEDIVSVVCWMREAPKGSLYRNICGFQFRFSDGMDRKRVQSYVANIKKKYKL
ncbi:MAG: PilZ domain-containing protein [Lachnospiraceae bacterium]|nr:PilZ domain-containing protein [Lachnospiraceae bacterium]